MQRQYRKLATAVRDFQRAARAVAGAWESVGDGGAVSHYPSWMPSFDEAVSDLLDMQVVVPEPTSDQLSQLGRMMHEASIGAYGITYSVEAHLADPPLEADQQSGRLTPQDFRVEVGAYDDENSETPGVERTFVTIIAPSGVVNRSYEVQ